MVDKTNLNETLAAIDAYIADKEAAIERGKALERLKTNKDFQSVIIEGYIDTEAKRLFAILTDPTGASPYSPEEIHLKLAAISHFKEYVGTATFTGLVESEALNAPGVIISEQLNRTQATADFAALAKEEV